MPRIERKWWTLVVVCTAIFMLLLDITIVNIALPDLVRSLHASFSDLEWVIDAYALSLAALLLIAGSLGDLAGARKVFLAGLAIFCASSLLCGIAQSPDFLIAFRAVQGVGGAAMFATSLALLAHQFRGRDRGIALAAWGATAGGAVAIGPLVGGALTSGISWRWIFLINVPIGIAAFAATVARVGEAARRPGVRPDWYGFLTLAVAMFAGIFGLIRGNQDGWTSPLILAAFGCRVVALAAFILVEHWLRDPDAGTQPVPQPRAHRGGGGSAGDLGEHLLRAALPHAVPAGRAGYSAFQIGLRFLPLTIPVILAAPIAGRLSARVSQRLLIGCGLALIAIGVGLMTLVSAASGWTVLLAGMIVSGLGSGLTNPALASAAVGTVSREKAGVGSGINNTFRQVGIAIGIAGLGAIFSSMVRSALTGDLAARSPKLAQHAGRLAGSITSGGGLSSVRASGPGAQAIAAAARSAFVTGLDRICWVAAATAAVGALVSAVLLRPRDISSAPEASAEHEQSLRRAA